MVLDTLRERVEQDPRGQLGQLGLRGQRDLLTVKLTVWLRVYLLALEAIL